MEKASYNKTRKEIKDLLNKPYYEKLFKYSTFELFIMILISLDLIMDKIEKIGGNTNV